MAWRPRGACRRLATSRRRWRRSAILPAPDGAIYGAPPNNPPPSEYLADATRPLADTAATIIDYTQGGIYYDGAYQDELALRARRRVRSGSPTRSSPARAGRDAGSRSRARESRPDIVTLGKSLGGGAAAVAAVVVSKAIVEQLKGTSWQNYGTLRGHPISMAAISAYLKVITKRRILSRVRQLEGLFAQRLLEIARRHPSVQTRGGAGPALDHRAAWAGLAELARRYP